MKLLLINNFPYNDNLFHDCNIEIYTEKDAFKNSNYDFVLIYKSINLDTLEKYLTFLENSIVIFFYIDYIEPDLINTKIINIVDYVLCSNLYIYKLFRDKFNRTISKTANFCHYVSYLEFILQNTHEKLEESNLLCRSNSEIINYIKNETPFIAHIQNDYLKNDFAPIISKLFIRDKSELQECSNYVSQNYDYLKQKIIEIKFRNTDIAYNGITKFQEILKSHTKRESPPQYISTVNVFNIIHTTVKNVLSKLNKLTSKNMDIIEKNGSLMHILQLRNSPELTLLNKITYTIIYSITGEADSIYTEYLLQNIYKKPLRDVISHVVYDYYDHYKISHNSNVTIINKNFRNNKHSKWQETVQNIISTLNNLEQPTFSTNLIIDTFLERTFLDHEIQNFNMENNIIPFSKPWIGFVHYPDVNILIDKLKNYPNSYSLCKAFIAMSECLAEQLRQYTNVPVYNLTQPITFSNSLFLWENFAISENKRLIQIGKFSRDQSAIYKLQLPSNSLIKQKCILETNPIIENKIHPILDEMIQSVEHLGWIPEEQYEELISNNIIFLYITKNTSICTIIECIVRHTPVIVNRIPITVELLGEEYPLFYDTLFDASLLLTQHELFQKANLYLQGLNKNKFKYKTFNDSFIEILKITA